MSIGSLIALGKGQSNQKVDAAKFHQGDETNKQIASSTRIVILEITLCLEKPLGNLTNLL